MLARMTQTTSPTARRPPSTTTRRPTRSRSRAWTPSSSPSATPSRPRTTTRPRSACAASPTAARRPGYRDEAAYVLESGRRRFVLRGAVRAGTDARPSTWPRTATASSTSPRGAGRATPRTRYARRARRHRPRGAARRRATSTARSCSPPSPPTARPGTRWSTGPRYTGPYLPGFVARASRSSRRRRPSGFFQADRPLRRQRRARPDGRVGRASTTGSWASRTWRSSSATTSPPSTPR